MGTNRSLALELLDGLPRVVAVASLAGIGGLLYGLWTTYPAETKAWASSFGAQLAAAIVETPTLTLNVVLGVVVVGIAVERFIFQVTQYGLDSKDAFARVKKLVDEGKIERAIAVSGAMDVPLMQVIGAGLTSSSRGSDDAELSMTRTIQELKPNLEARVGILAMMANIAMLIGLVGTITGLVQTFRVVSGPLSEADRARVLAEGISTAMNNTVLGLVVAAITLVAFVIIRRRTERIEADLAATRDRVATMLKQAGATA